MKKQQLGLTLIEVLIALAIVAIALTAIIKAATQNIRATDYLQQKIVANWVGLQVVNEARLGLLAVPAMTEGVQHTTVMLGQAWSWHARQLATPNKRIAKVVVDVWREGGEHGRLAVLEGYVGIQ